MKTLAITLFVLAGSAAIAQKHSSISRNINDDGKTLSIRVNGTVDGKSIDYDRTFNVASLNLDERNALRERILDSLNISLPEPPVPPIPPVPPVPPVPPIPPIPPVPPVPPVHPEVSVNGGSHSMVWIDSGDSQTVAVGGKKPFTKEVKYNSDTEQLYLRYRLTKDGDDFTYERTLDVKGKTQQERQRIIESIEKEIGVPVK